MTITIDNTQYLVPPQSCPDRGVAFTNDDAYLHPRWILRARTVPVLIGSDDPAILELLEAYAGPELLKKILYAENRKGEFNVVVTPDIKCAEINVLDAIAHIACGCIAHVGIPAHETYLWHCFDIYWRKAGTLPKELRYLACDMPRAFGKKAVTAN